MPRCLLSDVHFNFNCPPGSQITQALSLPWTRESLEASELHGTRPGPSRPGTPSEPDFGELSDFSYNCCPWREVGSFALIPKCCDPKCRGLAPPDVKDFRCLLVQSLP